MATQCSGDVHLSIKWPERVYTDLQLILIKFEICFKNQN